MPRKSNKPRSYKKRPVANKKYSKSRSSYKKKNDGPMAKLGSTIGSYFGNTGSKVGRYIGKAAGVITGSGSYEIHKNTLIADQVPYVHSTNEIVRIKHREFLGNINGSILFTNTTYNINPGLIGPFPWLYSTALSFEQYKINGMIVEFVSTCGDAIASTNNTLGTVCLSTDYNVVNDDFITMAQCQNSMWSSTGKPSKNIVMPIECDGKLNVLERLFIRNDNTALTNTDLRLYDHCKINISTEGQQVSTQIGQLWISYDISFYKPVLTNSLGQKVAHYNINNVSVGGNMFIASNLILKNNTIGIYFDNLNQRVYFPKSSVGKNYIFYLIMYQISGTYNWIDLNYTLTNLSANNVFNLSTVTALDAPFSSGAITGISSGPSLIVSLKVNAADGYISISGGVGISANRCELLVYQYD